MSIKTYTWVKYLATISSLLLLIVPLFCLLKVAATHFFIPNWPILMSVTIPLYCLGIIGLAFYFVCRLLLVKKSPYTYTKKDQLYLILAFGLYFLAGLMSGVYLLSALLVQDREQTLSFALFGVSYFFVIGGMIGGSIFETLSRVQEQIKLYHDQEATINAAKKAKRKQLLKTSTSEEEIETAIKANRTVEAEKLIERTKTQPVKKTTKKSQVPVKQKNASGTKTAVDYNPFLDEKMNEQLKNDPEFQEWLANDKKKKTESNHD